MLRRGFCLTSASSAFAACRFNSQRTGEAESKDWTDFWSTVETPSSSQYPRGEDGLPQHAGLYRKSRMNWWTHHGSKHPNSVHAAESDLPDWEYADGTPAPLEKLNAKRDVYFHNNFGQIVAAAARAEELAEQGRLPLIPGSKEQRDWDPNIPLFLEDEDEHGVFPTDAQTAAPGDLNDPSSLKAVSLPEASSRHHGFDGSHAPYNPAQLFTENVRPPSTRPLQRRKWALTNEFLIKKPTKPHNVINES